MTFVFDTFTVQHARAHVSTSQTSGTAFLCCLKFPCQIISQFLRSLLPVPPVKPDPPKNVSVAKVEGEETWMKVTWSLPSSWKSHDNFYDLIYQIKYRPTVSSFHFEQVRFSFDALKKKKKKRVAV